MPKTLKKEKEMHNKNRNVECEDPAGKLHLLLNKLEANDVDITGLSEIRWQGEGRIQSGDSTVIFSGGIRGQGGVAVILNKKLRGSMISYNPVSERILVVRLAMRPVNVTVMQVYAPTTTHSEEELDTFYEQLPTVKDGLRTRRDICVVMRDFNAKAGDVEDRESGVGKFGIGTRNENGERLASFCNVDELILTNTCFKHHKRNR